jgi:hypothetical protein
MKQAISCLILGALLSFSVLAQDQDLGSGDDTPARLHLRPGFDPLAEPIFYSTDQSGQTVPFPEWAAAPEHTSETPGETSRLVKALVGFGILSAGAFLVSTSGTRLARGEGVPHCIQIPVIVGGPVGSTQTGDDFRQIDQQSFCPDGRPPVQRNKAKLFGGVGLAGAGVTLMWHWFRNTKQISSPKSFEQGGN